MSRNKKSQNFLIQGSILAIASVLCRIIGILYRIPLTNIIGNTGMGYYNAAFEVYSILLIISSYSLPLAVSKLVSAKVAAGEYKNAYYIFQYARRFAIVVGLTVGIVTLAGADFFAKLTKFSQSALALKTLAPTLLIMSIVGVYRGYFQGLGTMIPTAFSNICEQIINAIISVSAAYVLFQLGKKNGKELEFGAAGGTIGTGAGALTALIFLLIVFVFSKRIFKRQLRRDKISRKNPMKNTTKILIMTIIPVLLSTTVYNISGLLDGAIFGNINYQKGIAEEVYTDLYGIYSAKYRTLMNVPIAIAASLASSIIPTLISSYCVNDMKNVKRKIHYSIRFSMIIAIPCAVGLAVLAKPIILLLFAHSTKDVTIPVRMMQIGAISVVFYSLSTITNSVLQGIDKMRIPVIHAAISVFVHILLLLTLMIVFDKSINAVVFSDAFFAFFICILNSIALKNFINYKQEYKRTFILPFISAIVMGVIIYILYDGLFKIFSVKYTFAIDNALSLSCSVIVGILVYGLMLLSLRAITKEDLLNLPKGNKIVILFEKLHLI